MHPSDFIRISNAQLRYYFKIDPASLDDNTWARRVAELKYIRELEAGKPF